jgi:hypothetical protein
MLIPFRKIEIYCLNSIHLMEAMHGISLEVIRWERWSMKTIQRG